VSARRPERAHRTGPRWVTVAALALWLSACSGSEGTGDAGTGGAAPTSGGSATGGASPPSGGSAAGGSTPSGGSAAGGATTGGATGGAGFAGGGGLGSGGTSSEGSAGAGPLGGSGGRIATGGEPPTGGRSENGGTAGASGGKASGGSGGGASGAGGATGGSGGASSSCPFQGSISYTLARAASPTAAQTAAYDRITAAVDKALGYYNCYTDLTKELRVSYEPSVATADGNVNGSIRFGSQDSMNYITAMHEIGHTLGVGSNEWARMLRDGVFTGPTATAKLREIDDDPSAEVHGDAQHFWPYGLNYTSEVKSEADLLAHCAMVRAIRADIYP